MFKKILLLKIDDFAKTGLQFIFDSLNFDVYNISEIANKNFLLTSMNIFKMLGRLIALGIIN